jgi:hypothetical protein
MSIHDGQSALQARQYATAIMVTGSVPQDEISTRGHHPNGQARGADPGQRPGTAGRLLGEAALRQRIGSRAIMAEQLAKLIELAARPNIEIRLLPFDSDWHPGLEGPVLLIDSETEPKTR